MARKPRRVQALRVVLRRGVERGGRALLPLLRTLRLPQRGLALGFRLFRPLLRPLRLVWRGVALGGRAVRPLLGPLRLLWRGVALSGHALQCRIASLALALDPRLLIAHIHQAPVYVAGNGEAEPLPLPRPRRKGSSIFYDRRGRRPPPPPPSPPPPPQLVVDGEVVPRNVLDRYIEYCTTPCSSNSTVCHFCVFEIQKSGDSTVPTWEMIYHCHKSHAEDGDNVLCPVAGCHVRVPPGCDLALHIHFVHDLPAGWWHEYKRK